MPNNIHFYSQDISFDIKQKRKIKKWLTELILYYNKSLGEISIVFCNNEYILQTNKQFLSHDYYTDIITFNYNENNNISGDLIISVDMVKENSEKFNESFERELLRVIAHGVLHLLGLKDKTKHDIKQMRQAEENALEML